MPRVTLNRVQTNMDYFNGWLIGTMKRQKKTMRELAEYLNISAVALSKKVNGKCGWSLEQVFEVYEFLGEQYEWR